MAPGLLGFDDLGLLEWPREKCFCRLPGLPGGRKENRQELKRETEKESPVLLGHEKNIAGLLEENFAGPGRTSGRHHLAATRSDRWVS